MTQIYDLTIGQSPLILSQPHPGVQLPEGMASRLTNEALQLPDTDWHIPELYAQSALQLNATVLTARYSRYVIDLNRNPEGISLYPGQSVTELCPTSLFDDTPLYQSDQAPSDAEVDDRTNQFWKPYHVALTEQIQRIKDRFGYVLLYDCHSIRSVVPRFFNGTLPDLNMGTADGTSLALSLQSALEPALQSSPYKGVLNGRFKGGYITRHYGDPAQNIHAVQMEIAQSSYMDEAYPFAYRADLAAKLQPVIHTILTTMLEHAQQGFTSAEGSFNE